MKIEKINITDIENISEEKSLWVSKRFSIWIFFWVIFLLFIWIIWFFWVENFWNIHWIWASILDSTSLEEIEVLHWSSVEIWENLKNSSYLNNFYIFLLILFFAIYTLYIFAKMELQKFWEQNWAQKDFVTRNFPSIYILETMTMLYVISFVVLSFYLIQQIDFKIAFETINSSLQSVANFALFWWSLSSLFYFLHKIRPWKFMEWQDYWPDIKVDFDINRVLKYLSFPFMSAWMWVVSYLIVMWIWDIFWIDFLKNPSEYFIILLATMAWYFCDAFVIFFHSIFKSIEKFLHKKIAK